MAPLPAVLVLQDTQVHVCTANGCNVLSNIEAPIDEHFGIAATFVITRKCGQIFRIRVRTCS